MMKSRTSAADTSMIQSNLRVIIVILLTLQTFERHIKSEHIYTIKLQMSARFKTTEMTS